MKKVMMKMFKHKKNEYEEASKDINKKEDKETSYERIIMEQIDDDDSRAAKLVDQMKEGHPLVINVKKLDLYGANKMLAFFSGATYAIGGKIIKLNETSYLYARTVDFLDGTLKEFIESL